MGPRAMHPDGSPISFDYAKMSECRHRGEQIERGNDVTCAGCGLIVACAPSDSEPQLRQIAGMNFLAMVGGSGMVSVHE